MNDSAVFESSLGARQPTRRGKVRDLYDLDTAYLMVATDRISAFDVVIPTPIPGKGRLLTQLSLFWFELLDEIVPNHLITSDVEQYPNGLGQYRGLLSGRSMLVRKAEVVPVECVVRGYLAGSGWKEYQAGGNVCGVNLPAGLLESDELPETIFTPTTKAESGHDLPITEAEVANRIGRDLTTQLKDTSIRLYETAASHALARGIIIADTKFEFGMTHDGILLIDEVLTPDSSRFWDAESYQPSRSQDSFDKQFARDYLETLNWDKTPPAPPLPPEVVKRTSEKYREAYRRLCDG